MAYTENSIMKMQCPFCGKQMFKQNRTDHHADFSQPELYWSCKDCVYIFTEKWLNDEKFMQYEKFVTRAKDLKDRVPIELNVKLKEVWQIQ